MEYLPMQEAYTILAVLIAVGDLSSFHKHVY